MCIRLVILGCILFTMEFPLAMAQDSKLTVVTNKMNHFNLTFGAALGQSNSLDLIESQRVQLAEMQKNLTEIFRGRALKSTTVEERVVELQSMCDQLETLNTKLMNDVLLPHQVNALRKIVFDNDLRAAQGNIVYVLTTYYADDFAFTANQVAKLKDVQQGTADEIKKAKEAFEKELERIAKSTEGKLSGILTEEQAERLKKMR